MVLCRLRGCRRHRDYGTPVPDLPAQVSKTLRVTCADHAFRASGFTGEVGKQRKCTQSADCTEVGEEYSRRQGVNCAPLGERCKRVA
jgi:hypothetical protein